MLIYSIISFGLISFLFGQTMNLKEKRVIKRTPSKVASLGYDITLVAWQLQLHFLYNPRIFLFHVSLTYNNNNCIFQHLIQCGDNKYVFKVQNSCRVGGFLAFKSVFIEIAVQNLTMNLYIIKQGFEKNACLNLNIRKILNGYLVFE